jgi:hypothetical protein
MIFLMKLEKKNPSPPCRFFSTKINDGAPEKGWYWGNRISLREVHPPIKPHKSKMAEHLVTAPECRRGDLWKGDKVLGNRRTGRSPL